MPWTAQSETDLMLHDHRGQEGYAPPHRYSLFGILPSACIEMFDQTALLRQAGDRGYVLIRDTTCRLFGVTNIQGDSGPYFDHMFGFNGL
ncbi:MAG: hypothetical protein R3E60_04155 [Alphaproteobacteria bacterium]